MSWIFHNGNYPTGSGDADGELADRIFNAPTRGAAVEAAREDGAASVEDAVDWLVSRSDGGTWVG